MTENEELKSKNNKIFRAGNYKYTQSHFFQTASKQILLDHFSIAGILDNRGSSCILDSTSGAVSDLGAWKTDVYSWQTASIHFSIDDLAFHDETLWGKSNESCPTEWRTKGK